MAFVVNAIWKCMEGKEGVVMPTTRQPQAIYTNSAARESR